MVDLIEKEKAVRTYQGGVALRLTRHARAAAFVCVLLLTSYLAYVVSGLFAAAATAGDVRGVSVNAPVRIYRDERGIPHIRAQNEHDLFLAEGYVQASDRLFQMDLIRRYMYGRLSEVLGPIQLPTDEAMRTFDARDVVEREWKALPPRDRAALAAFSAGVNAAMRTQPLPVEFRLLLYKPAQWTPRDSLAVVLAISASLGDTAENVRRRDLLWRSLGPVRYARWLPLSDPAYDVPRGAMPPRAPRGSRSPAWAALHRVPLPAAGSNAWAAGSKRTREGYALIANDPHFIVGIPGLWYGLEMRSSHVHVAGVTIPGVPGVVLGHNDAIAWASTNAVASTLSVFHVSRASRLVRRAEIFHARFSPDVVKYYYGSAREFEESGTLVRWSPYYDSRSAIHTVLQLDRAPSIESALRALSQYAGPAQNFVIAGADGRIAYHLAGSIPNDPAWGRYVHDASDIRNAYAPLPFESLPSVPASARAVVLSANNKPYGRRYPYRLSPMFAPPYRAYRIASLLRLRARYDAAYFARMQLDSVSPADAEFARDVIAYARAHPDVLPPAALRVLRGWSGDFSPDSRGATLEHTLRSGIEATSLTPYEAFTALRAPRPNAAYLGVLRDAIERDEPVVPWGRAGAIDVFHPFGTIGFPFLNGARLEGNGDEYTIRMQTAGMSQSFRAVWVAGDWERGGLSLPSGESGEIGSGHYADLRAAWERGTLTPLPFSDESVRRAARACLRLEK